MKVFTNTYTKHSYLKVNLKQYLHLTVLLINCIYLFFLLDHYGYVNLCLHYHHHHQGHTTCHAPPPQPPPPQQLPLN